jgi:excisionase family DNA binding protein
VEKWISVRQAARVAKVSDRTIHRWIDKGAVRVTRPSPAARRLLVRHEDVDPDYQYDTRRQTVTE